MDGRTPPEGDRWFFADPTRTRPWFAAIAESFRQGTIGYALEDVAALLPWGFSLADIEIPVLLFHGEQDAGQPREHLDFWIRTIRCAEVRVWPDAGHQGISRHWREVLESVAP